MSDESEIWELRHGEALIGTLIVTDQDLFWYSAMFEPTPEYAAFRPSFEEGSSVRMADDADAFDVWYKSVQQFGLRLVRLRDQGVASEFILYIDGREAEFRPRFDS